MNSCNNNYDAGNHENHQIFQQIYIDFIYSCNIEEMNLMSLYRPTIKQRLLSQSIS